MDILTESLNEAEEIRSGKNELSPHYINDCRGEDEFDQTTFSGFKRSSAKKELYKSLVDNNVESSVFWCAEFIATGLFLDIWENIFTVMAKHIHAGNPKLPIYVNATYESFRNAITPFATGGTVLMARNDPTVREIFTELVVVVCTSKKKPTLTPTKIDKKSCFDMISMTAKATAPSTKYVDSVFREDDPQSIYISLNEFAYHISSESNDIILAGYWIEWMIAFMSQCRKTKQDLSCESRTMVPAEYKYQKEPMGIMWEILLAEAKRRKNRLTAKIFNSLMELFYVRYTSGACSRRKFILYFAVELLVDIYSSKLPLMTNPEFVQKIRENKDIPYAELKKVEHSPATGYLEYGLESGPKTDAEKSIARLKQLNESGLF